MIAVRVADEEGIAVAAAALGEGRLVLHPTETLVSLTGNPYRPDAVAAAWRIKGYDTPRPFLCLVPDPAKARSLAAEWPPAAERLAAAFWPGPLTLVLRAAGDAPAVVTSGGKLAVRPANDPVSRALTALAGPLFSTSANRRGEPASTRVADAAKRLAELPGAEAIAMALAPEGPPSAALGRPSSIVDLTGLPRLVRAGAIPLERLREVVPELDTAE